MTEETVQSDTRTMEAHVRNALNELDFALRKLEEKPPELSHIFEELKRFLVLLTIEGDD